jgi:hypothetical protein
LWDSPPKCYNNASNVADQAAMKSQRPVLTDAEHHVLKFRPRTLAQPPGGHGGEGGRAGSQNDVRPEANDLSRYERTREEPDDFRHRMLANMAAFAFTVALTAIGIWLAMSIADLRKTQDCVLMGRRDCARISAPHS